MTQVKVTNKEPYNFGKALFRPFNTGNGGLVFMIKSAMFFAVVVAITNLLFGEAVKEATLAFNTLNTDLATTGNVSSAWLSGFGKLMLLQMPMFFAAWIVWAMIEAALHRRILLADTGGLFPWRFGGDELRVMLCQLVVYPAWFLSFIFIYMPLAIVGGLVGAMISPVFAAILVVVAVIAAFFLSCAFAIRFAAASAFSVANKQIGFGASWDATKRRVLPSFGVYSLLFVIGMIIYLIVMVVLMAALFGGEFLQMWQGAMQGDSNATNALYEIDGFVIKQTIQVTLLGIYTVILSLMVAGVGSHIAELHRTEMGMTDADVFD